MPKEGDDAGLGDESGEEHAGGAVGGNTVEKALLLTEFVSISHLFPHIGLRGLGNVVGAGGEGTRRGTKVGGAGDVAAEGKEEEEER